MFIAQLFYDKFRFYTSIPQVFLHFDEESPKTEEKNWVPLIYNDELLLAYSISPHRIERPIDGTHASETFSLSPAKIPWNWGILRGGTPALPEGDEYLAFFHSTKDMASIQSKGQEVTHYFMGAYTFASEPPFAITRISPEPIFAKNFYTAPDYKTWKPLRCVFAAGYVSNDDYVWVAYGRQDHESWIVKLDKKGLLNSLIPTSAIK
jgi:predicted GH43/DUF377 family glycosyl hydrolase